MRLSNVQQAQSLPTRSTWAGRLVRELDDPQTRTGRVAVGSLVVLIYASIVLLVTEARYPGWAEAHPALLQAANGVILGVFGAELVLRLCGYARPLRYLASGGGLIDTTAVVAGLLALGMPGAPGMAWVRSLRVLRLARILKFVQLARRLRGGVVGGVMAKLAPVVALAVAAKGVLVAAEAEPWWPRIGDLTVVIGVAGFAIGVLLGTKLSIAQNRLHDVEDAICRIVGALRDIPGRDPELEAQRDGFARALAEALDRNDAAAFAAARAAAQRFEGVLERAGIGGPTTAGLHRDVEFVLHRVTTRTPVAYEQFLRAVTISYAAMVIFAIPGLTGFFSVVLVIYILGGMYVVIDDMDRPLETGPGALTGIDRGPLEVYLAGLGAEEVSRDRAA